MSRFVGIGVVVFVLAIGFIVVTQAQDIAALFEAFRSEPLAQKLAWSTDWILWGNPALLSAKLATAIERLERKEAERPESAKRPSRRK